MAEKEIQYPKGIKWTKQRKEVCRVLQSAEEPMTAVQIYNRIVSEEPQAKYALSTIYRILAAFEEQAFVEKSSFMGEDTITYEWRRPGHTHYAVCLNCHKKVPVHVCPLEHVAPAQRGEESPWHEIAKEDDFVVTAHKLELYGYCKDCERYANRQIVPILPKK